jgi:hypothetical protein
MRLNIEESPIYAYINNRSHRALVIEMQERVSGGSENFRCAVEGSREAGLVRWGWWFVCGAGNNLEH